MTLPAVRPPANLVAVVLLLLAGRGLTLRVFVPSIPAVLGADIRAKLPETPTSNGGLGPRVVPGVYDTWQFALDVLLEHRFRLLEQHNGSSLADDPPDIYLPAYICSARSGPNGTANLKRAAAGLEALLHSPDFAPLLGRVPLVFSYAQVGLDVENLGVSAVKRMLHLPLVFMLTIEGTFWLPERVRQLYNGSSGSSAPWLLVPEVETGVVVVPYPGKFHFEEAVVVAPKEARTTLVLCDFNPKTAERTLLLQHCQKRPNQCMANVSGVTERASVMRRTVFCVEPKGDTPSRSAVYDAIAFGCIPVFFDSPNSAWEKPFEPLVPWRELCVTLGSRGLFEHSKTNFVDLLGKVTPAEVLLKQELLAQYARSLQYDVASARLPPRVDNYSWALGPHDDAFTLSVKDVLRRSRAALAANTSTLPPISNL